MKYTNLLLITMFIFSMDVKAQDDIVVPKSVSDSTIERVHFNWADTQEWNQEWSSVFTFDKMKNLTSYLYKQPDYANSELFDYEKYEYKYNDKGLKTNESRFEMKNSNWSEIIRTQYTYNSKGNITLKNIQLRGSDTIWKDAEQAIYLYDGNNNVIQKDIKQWLENKWINTYNTVWSYSNGKIEKMIASRWDSGYLFKEGGEKYTYNADGKLITTTTINYIDDHWVDRWTITIEYDSKGNILNKKTEDTWNVANEIYAYDESGLLTSYTYQLGDEKSWKNHTRIIYNYDEGKRVIGELGQKFLNGRWANDYREDYEYKPNTRK